MRLGVLDIGSNSAQLLVVDARPGAPPLPAHVVKEPTLLGELIEPDGSIPQEGIDRVAAAVARAVEAAQCFGVDQLYPFATSAIRDAANRDAWSSGSAKWPGSSRNSCPVSRKRASRIWRCIGGTAGRPAAS